MQLEIKRDEIDFMSKTVIRDKEDHYIMINELNCQEYIIIINSYALSIAAHKCIR
jgi:hypothetical protein